MTCPDTPKLVYNEDIFKDVLDEEVDQQHMMFYMILGWYVFNMMKLV